MCKNDPFKTDKPLYDYSIKYDISHLPKFLQELINQLEEYDKESDSHEFINNYKVDINNISNEDYVYIDYRDNETGYEYFVIYYFETSNNELHFLQLIYN